MAESVNRGWHQNTDSCIVLRISSCLSYEVVDIPMRLSREQLIDLQGDRVIENRVRRVVPSCVVGKQVTAFFFIFYFYFLFFGLSGESHD